jgi:hypothetical protein
MLRKFQAEPTTSAGTATAARRRARLLDVPVRTTSPMIGRKRGAKIFVPSASAKATPARAISMPRVPRQK